MRVRYALRSIRSDSKLAEYSTLSWERERDGLFFFVEVQVRISPLVARVLDELGAVTL